MRYPLASFFALSLAIIAGCNPMDNASRPIIVPAPPELGAAPETLDWNGQAIVLGAHLWRDFMPVAPPDGQGLIVSAVVRGAHSSTMTSTLIFRELYVVHQGRAWVAEFEGAPAIPELSAVTARDGPKWGPHVSTEVVARIEFPDGTRKLIALRNAMVTRTD